MRVRVLGFINGKLSTLVMSFSAQQVSVMLAGSRPVVGRVLSSEEEEYVSDVLCLGTEVRFFIGRSMVAAVERGSLLVDCAQESVESEDAAQLVWSGVCGHYLDLVRLSQWHCFGGQLVFRSKVEQFVNDCWAGAGKAYCQLIGLRSIRV